MKQPIILNSRQKQLLQTLIDQEVVSYEFLSDTFKLSIRTIQREIKAISKTLKNLDIKITKNKDLGIHLQGSDANIAALRSQLPNAQVMSMYSKEERQDGIAYNLLLSSEPLKQGYFSTKYDVSIATIAHDLDAVSELLKTEGITVSRLPGIGIEVNGTEKQRRTLLSRLLHKDITFEDWMALFHKKRTEVDIYGKLGYVIRSRLLKFVQMDKILLVERVLSEELAENDEITLNDRSYVNLMIHILLAMERIESGKVMEDVHINQWEPLQDQTLSIAKNIVNRLGRNLRFSFPNIEIKYIALHLAGSKLINKRENNPGTDTDFFWIEITQSFIRSVEYYLEESFEGDQLLFEGLVSHFIPVFNRLKYNLQIHNPMLDNIIEHYPKVFNACEQACYILTEKIGYEIPKDEVGYLAMHLGASMIRVREGMEKRFKAVVVCVSGLGTSMYLATKLRSEIPNLEVEKVISVNEIDSWMKTAPPIDIIISTVNLPVATNRNMVIVSPFLKKDDVAKIKNNLVNTMHYSKLTMEEANENLHTELDITSVKSIATYGEGMLQILHNFNVFFHVKSTTDLISNMIKLLKPNHVIKNRSLLVQHLKQREKKGGFVLDSLAMIHTKSAEVLHPLVAVYRMDKPVLWYGDDNVEHDVQTFILLVVPSDAPEEHMEIISEIPASLVDQSFVHELETGSENKVKSVVEEVLTKAFETKARLLKGHG